MASMLRDLAMEGARNLKLQTAMAAGLAKDLAHKAGADKLRTYKDEVIYHERDTLLQLIRALAAFRDSARAMHDSHSKELKVMHMLQSLSVFAAGSAIDMFSCSLQVQAALGRDDGLSSACAAACCMVGHQQEQLAGEVKQLMVQYGELRLVSGAFAAQLDAEYHADVAPLLEQFVRLRRECLFHAEQATHHAAADSERAKEYEAKMADFQHECEVVATKLRQEATDLLAKMSSELVGHVQEAALVRVRVYAAAGGTFTPGSSAVAAAMIHAHPQYAEAAAAAAALAAALPTGSDATTTPFKAPSAAADALPLTPLAKTGSTAEVGSTQGVAQQHSDVAGRPERLSPSFSGSVGVSPAATTSRMLGTGSLPSVEVPEAMKCMAPELEGILRRRRELADQTGGQGVTVAAAMDVLQGRLHLTEEAGWAAVEQ